MSTVDLGTTRAGRGREHKVGRKVQARALCRDMPLAACVCSETSLAPGVELAKELWEQEKPVKVRVCVCWVEGFIGCF